MIEKELIVLSDKAGNRKEVLNSLISKATALGYINDESEFLNAVMLREEMIPTSIGFGVAIPHGRCDAVERPFVALLREDTSFLWDDRNEELVDLVFLIGVPETSGGNLHLKFLSEISKKLMHEDFRDLLRTEQEVDTIYNLFEDVNKKMMEENL